MKTFSLTATFTVTVHMKVKAKNRKDALAEAEAKCFCVIPLFDPESHDFEKPRVVELECGDAWFDSDQLDNQLIWES